MSFRFILTIFLSNGLISCVSAQQFSRPVHTYSIVTRDPATGQLGVAVQSHWFSVGSLVTWAEAGVGAVATQSFVDPAYGPLGLELMRAGKTAQQALEGLLKSDPGEAVRQVAMIDAKGNVAAHTGSKCIPGAGHITGDNFSVQANLMLNDKVWPAMAEAYKNTNGDLAVEHNDMDKALREYGAAQAMMLDNLEMTYWTAVSLVNAGRLDESLPLFKKVFAGDPNWAELTPRLPKMDLLKADEAQLQKILSVAPKTKRK
jgi:hypothetical protein